MQDTRFLEYIKMTNIIEFDKKPKGKTFSYSKNGNTWSAYP